jgi:hypothetical protein
MPWQSRVVLALFVLCPSFAAAQSNTAAERLAAEIRSALPGALVTAPDPNGLDITYAGEKRSLGISSVNAACAQGGANCDAAIHSYAQRAVSYMLDAIPLRRDQLRIAVRSRAYLDNMNAQINSSPGFVVEPLGGDLVSVCYRDLPAGRRPITPLDLAVLQLDHASALALCKLNSQRSLAALSPQWKGLPKQGIGYIRAGDDVTGYLSTPEDWRPLAERLGGLIVAVPSIDTLLYARGSSEIDVDAVVALAEHLQGQASSPVSAQVLRWTDGGWAPVGSH